jgi:hypothetical protein
MDIGEWLRSLDLGRYEEAFRDNEIDEQILPKALKCARWCSSLRPLDGSWQLSSLRAAGPDARYIAKAGKEAEGRINLKTGRPDDAGTRDPPELWPSS